MPELFRRIAYLLNSRRRRRELKDELAFHSEMAARAGRTGRSQAARFGNSTRLAEQAREAWGWTWIDRLLQDLRYALRTLFRSPAFTITAILVLAIGIGTNIFIFSIINLLFLKPLPLRDPQSLVRLERQWPEALPNSSSDVMPYPVALFYRDHATTLSAVILMLGERLEFEDGNQPIRSYFVSANYFEELDASASLGRLLDPVRDAAPGAPLVAVISPAFWQRQFKSDPLIVGKTILLNHKHVTIVGVEPDDFPGLGGAAGSAEICLPINQQPQLVLGSSLPY